MEPKTRAPTPQPWALSARAQTTPGGGVVGRATGPPDPVPRPAGAPSCAPRPSLRPPARTWRQRQQQRQHQQREPRDPGSARVGAHGRGKRAAEAQANSAAAPGTVRWRRAGRRVRGAQPNAGPTPRRRRPRFRGLRSPGAAAEAGRAGRAGRTQPPSRGGRAFPERAGMGKRGGPCVPAPSPHSGTSGPPGRGRGSVTPSKDLGIPTPLSKCEVSQV